jgi:hypothetical protein
MAMPIRSKFQLIVAALLLGTCRLLNAQLLTKEDLLREITTYEASSLQAKTPDMTGLQAGRIWLHLGTLYQDAGMYYQSEQAL